MKKILFLFLFLVLIMFSVLLIFNKSDTPTGNVVLNDAVVNGNNAGEVQDQVVSGNDQVKEATILPKPKNYLKGAVELKPNYVFYQVVKEDSGSNLVNLHYEVISDNPVEFMLFPTKNDMIFYSELKNMKYDRYYCGGFGKNIRGDCIVDDLGFSIWNSDGGISVTPDYKLIFAKNGRSFEISPQKSFLKKRLLTS